MSKVAGFVIAGTTYRPGAMVEHPLTGDRVQVASVDWSVDSRPCATLVMGELLVFVATAATVVLEAQP